MHGILLVDKPTDWTSFDVVNKVRGVIKKEMGMRPKVGHAGTLDPFATGLLILLIGKQATKKQNVFMKLPKTYTATAILGRKSTTGDPEGDITSNEVKDTPTTDSITDIEDEFQGEILQKPHTFSAVKVKGKRAYERARKGEDFELEPRPVTVHSLEIKKYDYPELELGCTVSSGTYIRTLVEDIGDFLHTGAYTKRLRREAIGTFQVDDALTEVEVISYDIIKSQLIALESIQRL